jgi:hypothetical protein
MPAEAAGQVLMGEAQGAQEAAAQLVKLQVEPELQELQIQEAAAEAVITAVMVDQEW